LRFSSEKVESSRNFANKVWNASRFVLMNFDENLDFSKVDKNKFTIADRWILSRINTVTKEVTDNIDKFELGLGLQKVYDFIWEEFCDWYIEMVKPRLYDRESEGRLEAQYVLNFVLGNAMKLLHPYMPFITEEIYTHLINDGRSIMISEWPVYSEELNFADDEAKMKIIMDAIRSTRNIRAEMNVPPSRKAKMIFVAEGEAERATLLEGTSFFQRLASASEVAVQADKAGVPSDAVGTVIAGAEIFIPLDELIDIEKEIERLTKEKANLEGELKRVEGKLGNEGFVAKAPPKVIEEEKAKREKYKDMYQKVVERLESLKK
jgi:valyl-tRNA synthetase